MKAIHAYIRQSLAEHVIAELVAAGCCTMSVLDVRGVVDHRDMKDLDYSIALAQRIEHITKLEILATDENAARWAAVITHSARTGQPGDGLVCLLGVESAARLSTGETGDSALADRTPHA
jgi:nitrogen regulatory protein PII